MRFKFSSLNRQAEKTIRSHIKSTVKRNEQKLTSTENKSSMLEVAATHSK